MSSSVKCTEEDINAFGKHLENFSPGNLRRITEHFHQDLIYVVENDVTVVLQGLVAGRVLTAREAQTYEDVKNQQDSTRAAEKLADDFLSGSMKMAVGLWKCLFALRSKWSHPNLDGMVEEILQNGPALLEEITLNECGRTLDPEVKVWQEEQKSLLYEQTRHLREGSREAQPEESCFPIVSRYVDLKMVSDNKFRKRSYQEHEALAAAGELNEFRLRHKIQVDLERITPDRLFRWCFRSRRTPRSVMLSGVAGVGKTTLVQKFVFDWVEGKHYQKFAFLFFFKFRDLNAVEKGATLEGLIQQQYPKMHDKVGKILEDPEKLLFIFDGLDESKDNLDLSSSDLCVQPGDVKPVNVIVASLLKQKLLKGCSVLLTSRPSRLVHLETGVLHRVATIVGFLSQERVRYFYNFFGEDAVAQKALAHVRDSQVLYTLCYNPSYCWITCTALQPCFTSNSGQPHALPSTVTQLFISFVKHMVANHTRGLSGDTNVREILRRLGSLADWALNNRSLVFDENALEVFIAMVCHLPTCFLVENFQGDSSSFPVTYSFVHLTVQEFFAALVHYLDGEEDNFKDTMEKAKGSQGGEYEIFLRFLSGLSHPTTRAPLEEILGTFSPVITQKVIDLIIKMDCKTLLSTRSQDGKRKALNFFNLLFEAQNSQLVRQVMGNAARVDFSGLILTPVDCDILAYVLSCCEGVELLNLDSCYVQTEGLEKLSPELHKIRELSLCSNYLKDSAVKHLGSALKNPECQMHRLSLAKNVLTEKSCEDLSLVLLRNHSLLTLDLAENKMRDEGLSILLGVFRNPQCKIQKLVIQENALTDASCKILCSALAENTTLTHLNLSGNPFTDRCANEMRNLILTCRSLKEIRLSLSDITPAMEGQLKKLESDREDLKIII
ncbi:NACHT, LRR and PYD domains-containing protein 3-like [Elgaria multicarinata webbii]|uniref:NACHT, LRR and PYD domains-containing protein 3-like n=1 Tax=Elgaria multicarinata webbii TaxID=159646 RepID=UPI002FCCC5EF